VAREGRIDADGDTERFFALRLVVLLLDIESCGFFYSLPTFFAFLSSRKLTKRLCRRWPSDVHSTNSNCPTSTGLSHRQSTILAAVSPTRQRPAFFSGRFANGVSSGLNFFIRFARKAGVNPLFGLWCWSVPVRSGWRAARGIIWFWIILEICNGVGHSALAVSQGGYFPGVSTAPLLLLFASWTAILDATGPRNTIGPSMRDR
jgi:hypothetical protein